MIGSPIFSRADLVPGPLGVKVTFILQEDPAGCGTGASWQVVEEIAKSLALGPVMVAPVINSSTLCGFVSVIDWEVLVVPIACEVKASEVGDGTSFAVAVPPTVNVWETGVASSLTLIVPLGDPTESGMKLTATTQLEPARTGVPGTHVVAAPFNEKPAGKPVIEVICSGTLRLLVSVTLLTTVFVIATEPKSRLVGFSFTVPTGNPVPESDTTCGLLLTVSVIVTCPPVVVPTAVGWKKRTIVQLAPGAT